MSTLSFSLIKSVHSLKDQSHLQVLAISEEQHSLDQIWQGQETAEAEVVPPSQVGSLLDQCKNEFKIIILDVVSSKIRETLQALRENPKCSQSLILVNAFRLPTGPELSGVLPMYRAMPCSLLEMQRLLERSLPGIATAPPPRPVL
jgi:hypothetical protein